jgi:hypothetical protein
VHFVAFREEELCKVRTVLPGDAGDQCSRRHGLQSIALLSLGHSENRVGLTVDMSVVPAALVATNMGRRFEISAGMARPRSALNGTVEDRAKPSLLSFLQRATDSGRDAADLL